MQFTFKRTALVLSILVMFISIQFSWGFFNPFYANLIIPEKETNVISRFSYIYNLYSTCITTGEVSKYMGYLEINGSYKTKITIILQYSIGGGIWYDLSGTSKTVENYGAGEFFINNNTYAPSGCLYRCKTTALVYDTTGNILETAIAYSN